MHTEPGKVPHHVGIILDGNRRWARQKGKKTFYGHRRGYERAVEISEYAFEKGVRILTLFVFSTENWNRSKSEVTYLMNLLLRMIDSESKRLHKKGIQLKIIGTQKRLSRSVLKAIKRAEALTKHNSKGILQIAFNYGGRQEIVDAVNELYNVSKRTITETMLSQHLYTAGVPDPDLIIRTSGEQRLSGFLLWQSAYSELYFIRKMWPSFTKRDFGDALIEYSNRKRRFGT